MNNHIHIHEKVFLKVYKDYRLSFQKLLVKENSYIIDHRNLQKLVVEIFKVKDGFSPKIMKEMPDLIKKPYFIWKEILGQTKFKQQNMVLRHRILLVPNFWPLFQMIINILNIYVYIYIYILYIYWIYIYIYLCICIMCYILYICCKYIHFCEMKETIITFIKIFHPLLLSIDANIYNFFYST